MSRSRGSAPVVAVIDWVAAANLKDNTVILRRAGLVEEGRPRRRGSTAGQRSLLVRADGSCELQRFTARTVARRLLAATTGTTGRKTGAERRD